MSKKYWKGTEELNHDPEFIRLRDNEFFEHLPVHEVLEEKVSSSDATPRRDFLKLMGFGIAAASLAACQAPVKKSIPYLVKPEEITPGIPNWYASTFADGYDYCSVLVKTREGRPIKIEGNTLSSVTKGKVSARVQASVLSLYDSTRLRYPTAKKNPIDWKTADTEISSKLAEIAAANGNIRILSSTVISPSTKKIIAEFIAKYPAAKHVTYDAISSYGITKANGMTFGKAVIPSYRFDNADVIVSFACDFLVNWISPVEHARQYGATRKLYDKKTMSKHIHFEPNVSVTGSNADNRHKLKASEHGAAVLALYNKVASLAGQPVLGSAPVTSADEALSTAARELWNHKGKSLVVSGSNDANVQSLVNGINVMLGSYGSTIDLDNPCYLRQGNDEEYNALISEMINGQTAALIVYNCNPAYTWYSSDAFSDVIKKVKLTVSLADREDETASLCEYVCPDSHYLESWSDAEPVAGKYSLGQPTIQKLFNTRQAQESLLAWAGNAVDYHSYLQNFWKENIYPKQSGISSFEAFWNKSLQDGVFETASAPSSSVSMAGNLPESAQKIIESKPSTGVEVVLYEKTGIGTGAQANNPWLQELPDPVSRVCWDNYIAVSPAFAKAQGYVQGNIVEIKSGSISVKAPIYLQPGQADNTVAIALGYGRTKTGKAGNGIGKNVYPLASFKNGSIQYYVTGASLNKTVDTDAKLAATQTHHTMMGRAIVRETSLEEYLKNPIAGNEPVLIPTPEGMKRPADVDLWATEKHPGHPKVNHLWGMAIDLNSCIGCGACVVACTAENNVPVVGKDEIGRSREMHWIRIDRYYSSDADPKSHGHGVEKKDYKAMEVPSDDPSIVFMPVTCQHCNHAPCETVCPVVATTHSMEGLNMMAYNRCIGTRYCENNCPYKVRRFNWFKYSDNEQFDYNMNDSLGKMVLNPDVVVRSRGVMEKCTLCIQRIQYGKLEAKKAGRRPADGEINTACAQTCPTNAIIFGDLLDPNSEVSRMHKDERAYTLLEELDTQPNIRYHTKVRNRETEKHETHKPESHG